MQHWYVYYKIPASEVATVVSRVGAMQRQLTLQTGVQGTLQQRTDAAPLVTLMEVYPGVAEPAAFGAALARAAAACGLPAEWLAGRRVEHFADCAATAPVAAARVTDH